MMARKLAGFLAILALVVLFGAWLVKTWRGEPSIPVDKAVSYGFTVLVVYFVVGVFVAKVGIGLIQEVLAERRHREEERRYRARMRYEQLLGEEEGESAGSASAQEPPSEAT